MTVGFRHAVNQVFFPRLFCTGKIYRTWGRYDLASLMSGSLTKQLEARTTMRRRPRVAAIQALSAPAMLLIAITILQGLNVRQV